MQITSEIIYLGIAIVSAIFAVFLFFRRPQEQGEINDKVSDEKYIALKDIVINLRDNHIHTLDLKLDKHISDQTTNELNVAKQLGSIEAKLDMLIKK
jgi:hypothetical protein